MRVLTLTNADNEIFVTLVQSVYYQGNQGGSSKNQELTVELQDLLDSIGTKYKEDVRGMLVDAIELKEGPNSISLTTEASFELLKSHFENASKIGAFSAKRAVATRKYLDNVPFVKES